MLTRQPRPGAGGPSVLLEATAGQRVRILRIEDEGARVRCIRFGIGEGTVVSAEPLRLGPVLVRHAECELALGRELARQIIVEVQPDAVAATPDRGPDTAATSWARRLRTRWAGWREPR